MDNNNDNPIKDRRSSGMIPTGSDMLDIVNEMNNIGISTIKPQGAIYCYPNISKTGLSSEEFAIQLVEKEKVAVIPGNVFGKGGEGHIRICYACNMEELQEAVKRIKRFIPLPI